MEKVIVTGANGFVGLHLSRTLTENGIEVHGLVNERRDRIRSVLPDSHVHETPLRTADARALVNDIQPSTVYHLAASYRAESDDDVDQLISANFTCGAVLLEAASQLPKKPAFITAASFFQFSDCEGYNPNSAYAACKQAFQDLLGYYRSRKGVPALALVLYDTYGPADPRNKLWSALLESTSGRVLPLSGGAQVVELIHVFDVVAAFRQAANLLHAGRELNFLYSVPSGERKPLRTLVEEVKSAVGCDITVDWGALPYRDNEIFVPCSLTPLPDWKPQVTLADGFRALCDSFSTAA